MKTGYLFLLAGLLCLSALAQSQASPDSSNSGPENESALVAARRGFSTHLLRKETTGRAPEKPPAGVLDLVSYSGPLGLNAAYVSPSPNDGKRHPAIIWLVGGFSNSIGSVAWVPASPGNDQSARGFRDAGILIMYPSLRGGNSNPGFRECLFGEVEDVMAAARYLANLPYVDPERIYLGGHSTGGTLALLVAESSNQFRSVYALGPVGNADIYGKAVLPYDSSDPTEGKLRSPQFWLESIRVPTFVFEGSERPGNLDALYAMSDWSRNALVRFHVVKGGTHFSIISPTVKAIAEKIKKDEPK